MQSPAFDRLGLSAGNFGWLGGIDQIRSRKNDEADKGGAGLHVITLLESSVIEPSSYPQRPLTLLAKNRV
jgi:hypothetical protein